MIDNLRNTGMRDSDRPPMRIAINAQLVSSERSFRNAGVSRYIRQLVEALSLVDSGNHYYIFTSSGLDSFVDRPNFQFVSTNVDSHAPMRRIVWEQAALPGLLRRYGIDVLHSPMNVMPLACSCASVVTVHDLSFRLHAATHASRRNWYLKAGTAFALRRSNALITFSEAVRAELVDQYDVCFDKIRAIPLAPTPGRGTTLISPRRPFFLCVGTLEPRKNLARVFEAFARVQDEVPHDLIVVGAKGWRFEALFEWVRRLRIEDRTVFKGYVDDATLSSLYAHAAALIYPSLYEGFGLPPLEAMAHRCPTIVSSTPSLVELTADAALHVDPYDVEGMAAALLRVAQDPTLCEKLAARSADRAACFSWRRTAEKTLAVYQSVWATRTDYVVRSMER